MRDGSAPRFPDSAPDFLQTLGGNILSGSTSSVSGEPLEIPDYEEERIRVPSSRSESVMGRVFLGVFQVLLSSSKRALRGPGTGGGTGFMQEPGAEACPSDDETASRLWGRLRGKPRDPKVSISEPLELVGVDVSGALGRGIVRGTEPYTACCSFSGFNTS